MCAGPYSQMLLGINPVTADKIRRELEKKDDTEIIRPGYTRISFAYYTPKKVVDYVVKAVGFIAEHGYKLLTMYRCEVKTGSWRHVNDKKEKERMWMTGVDYEEEVRGCRASERDELRRHNYEMSSSVSGTSALL